jgi:hypothetical protein
MPNVVRYNNVDDAAKSSEATTLRIRSALDNTEYFKVVDGYVLWHDQTLNINITTPIDYNAKTETLATTTLPKDITKVTVNGVVSVGKNAFEGCSSLYTVVLPDAVTEIGKSAFSGCSKLINFTIPASLTVIYQSAFSGCAKLGYNATEALDLTGITLYEKAFASCSSLTAIKVDSLPTSSAVFSGCSKLEDVTVGENTFGKELWVFDDNGNIVIAE